MATSTAESLGATKVHARSLAWHLTILCLALVLPILILAAVLAGSYAKAERGRIEQDALKTAHELMAATDHELSGLVAATKVLSASRSLQRDDLDIFDALARDVYQQVGINVVLRDRESRQLVNTRVPRGTPLPTNVDPESDRMAMETKKAVISDLFIGAITRRPLFIVNVPVLRDGEVIYFLNLSLEPERIRNVILQSPLGPGWTGTIADRRGFVVAHSSNHESMLNRQLPMSIRSGSGDRDGVVWGQDPVADHQPVLIAFSRSQLAGWLAVVTVPAEQVAAPQHRSLAGVIGVSIVFLSLSVGLAVAFSRRIEGPVGALALQAGQFGRGAAIHPLATPVREVNKFSFALSQACSERLMAETALRESEARLQLAQSAGRIGSWDWEVTTGRAICSRSYYDLYGLDPTGPGHSSPEAWLAQVHPDDRERVTRVWHAALLSGRLENEYRIVRSDGKIRWIVDRGVPMFDAKGRLTRFIRVNVDVTERHEAEQRLHELQSELLHASRLSAMGQMAAALAHELNQPLGAATNFLSAARLALKGDTPDGPKRALARIEKGIEQTTRAGAILGRLRDYIGRGETHKRIVSARQLIEDAVELALVGEKDPSLRVRLDFAECEPSILADRIQIQQIIFNLLRNALKATEGKVSREIVVATRAAMNAELEISVADTGPGLPDDLEAVFQPFTTTKTKGMGIGLSICRTIVEAHGGHLWAEQRAGGGAVFRFTLPAALAQEGVHA